MDLNIFKSQVDKLAIKNKALTITLISLSIVIILLTWTLISKIENQKVIIIPPATNLKEFWVQGNIVSSSYLEMMADTIAYSVLNATEHHNINLDFILSMVPAKYMEQIRTSLIEQKNYIIDNGLTQVFFINDYDTNQKGKIKVVGILKRYIREKQASSEIYTFNINYKITRQRFWITGINLKKGNKQ